MKDRADEVGCTVGRGRALLVEVVKESSASSHGLGTKASRGDGCDERVTRMGKVKEASMSIGIVGFCTRGHQRPILTLFFTSITAPLSTSGSTRSRSPFSPKMCRGVYPCDTTIWDDKKRRRK